MPQSRRLSLGLALVALSYLVLFWPVVRKLVGDWSTDDNYSHGFFIVPLALFFVWERRQRLRTLPRRPSAFGLVLLAAGIALLLGGTLGAELFLTRIALIVALAGIVVFVLGWRHFMALAFPFAFLLLMIPIPALVFNQIAFPLQLVASQTGEAVLRGLSIPVLREGNVMILANTSLEVAEACSGIRSLITLLTLAIVYGYFIDTRWTMRALLAVMTIPIAIVTNGLRVAGTGVAAHYYGAAAADGFFHTFSGWMVFLLAFAILFVLARLLHWISPATDAPAAARVGSASPATV